MEISKISSKGQITIPVSVRNKLHIETGDNVVFFEEDGRFYIENASAITLKYIGTDNTRYAQYDFTTKNDGQKVAESGIR